MKTILVGVDGSEPAAHAARVAAELAKATDSTVLLAYVSMPNLLPAVPYAKLIREMAAEEHAFATKFLEQQKAQLSGYNVPVELAHLIGPPAETFVDLADTRDVWMAVVGSRGRGAVSRVMLGSFADRVVHICKKPVLVVK